MNRPAPSSAFLRSAILTAPPWVYALLVVVSHLAAPVGEFDDALPLVHGVLIQQGCIPTIHFRSFYPPLGPYVTAALFNLFGRSVIATRILDGGIYIFLLVLLERLFAHRFPRSSPRAALTILLLAATLGRALDLPSWPGFGLSAVALLVYLLSREGGEFAWLTLGLSGALTGLALLYRVNFGGYVALVVAADIAIEYRLHDRSGWRGRSKQALVTATGFLVPTLVCVSIFCLAIYGNRFTAAISEFTVTSQKIMLQRGFIDLTWSLRLAGALLFPAVWMFLHALSRPGKLSWGVLPAVALGLGLLISAMAFRDHVSVVAIVVLGQLAGVIGLHLTVLPLPRLERALLLFYCLQLHYYLSRADGFHSKFLPFAAVLLLTFLWPERVPARELGNLPFSRWIVPAGLVALLFIVLLLQPKVSLNGVRHGMDLIADLSLHRPLADSDRVLGPVPLGAAWASVYSDADELRALRRLRQITTGADPIFVGVQDHSRVFYNNLRIYWLSGRLIGVREFQLEDRIATEAAVQREIIHDLDHNHVNWAIIDREQHKGDDTFVRRAYSGSTLLDGYLFENFKEESHFGRLAILRRAVGSLPQPRPVQFRPLSVSPTRRLP